MARYVETLLDKNQEVTSNCGNLVTITPHSCAGIAFLLDAFDRYPAEDSFIYTLVKCKALPNCTLVVASCPHASAYL